MFCPNCGTENSKGQKFCTRCGTNLLAIDRAREIITEMANSTPATSISPNLLFGTVVLMSIIGFIAVTTGTIELYNRDGEHTPMPVVFCLSGFTALVLICRYLLGLLKPAGKAEVKSLNQPTPPSSYAPPPSLSRGTTNRALGEAAMPNHSIVEDPTRQFERDSRSNS